MNDFTIQEPERSARVKAMLDAMHASATDPDAYILHRMHSAVLLAGGCIAGRILGAPNAWECWLTAEKELDAPLQLEWKTLKIGLQHERLLKAMKQLLDAAQNPELSFQARVMHADVLAGMCAVAYEAGMSEASNYKQLAWEMKLKIRLEESDS